MKSANYYPVPWMTGVVQNEGAVRAAAIVANKTLLADFNSKFNQLLPKMVTFQTNSQRHNALIVKRLKEFYLNKTSSFSDENAQAFIDVNCYYFQEIFLRSRALNKFSFRADYVGQCLSISTLQVHRNIH